MGKGMAKSRCSPDCMQEYLSRCCLRAGGAVIDEWALGEAENDLDGTIMRVMLEDRQVAVHAGIDNRDLLAGPDAVWTDYSMASAKVKWTLSV